MKGERIFIFPHPGDPFAVTGDHRNRLILWRELFIRLANGFSQVIAEAGTPDPGKIGAESTPFALDHVALGAFALNKENLLTRCAVSGNRGTRTLTQGAEKTDNHPNLSIVVSEKIRGHLRTRHPISDRAGKRRVTVAVLPAAQSQIRAAAPSLPVEPVTDAAYHSEQRPALNKRSGIIGKRILTSSS